MGGGGGAGTPNLERLSPQQSGWLWLNSRLDTAQLTTEPLRKGTLVETLLSSRSEDTVDGGVIEVVEFHVIWDAHSNST
eukprot:2580047-Pyramimonas_sp.AAC.1